MAFKLTAKTRSILNQIEKNPSVVLQIEGIETIYGSTKIVRALRWDDPSGATWDQEGLTWDGSVKDETALDLIDIRQSTRAISQQIYPDKDGGSSIASAVIKIVDKDAKESLKFARDKITEILGKKCTLYIGFVGGNFKEDYMPVINAIVVNYAYQGGSIYLTLSHVDTLRRQAVLSEYSSNLIASIDNTITTFDVTTTENLVPSQDALTTYIRIDDEIMEILSIDSPTQLTVRRSELNTVDTSHDADAEITSLYRLKGDALELAQKLMQSDSNNSFFESDIPVKSLNFVDVNTQIANAVIFDVLDVQADTGLIPNDIINVDSYGDLTVQSFGQLDDGSSYIIDETLPTVEDASNESWRFKSQYNVLNFGLGMLPFEVDNEEFERTKINISTSLTELDFRLEEGIDNCRDFINKELYFIAGCYGIPRNARSSIRALLPPLSIETIPTLNEKTILNTISLRPERSVNKFYYNDILFAYNKSLQDNRFKSFTQSINQDSVNDFQVGNKQLRIESLGYIRNAITDSVIDRLAARFLSRYKAAATVVKKVELPFKTGFNIQVGDVVFFGGENVQLPDYNTGIRQLPVDLYEVINQSISFNGVVTVDLLSTGFSTDGTFAVISISSKVGVGSTTDRLIVEKINNLNETEFERDKYNQLIGARIRVRSEDYSYDEVTRIDSLDLQNPEAIIIDKLASTPPIGAIIELDLYDNYAPFQDNDLDTFIKLKYAFNMDQAQITSVTNSVIFEIDDTTRFYEGQKVAIHSLDYTRDTLEATINTITTNTIELTESLGFTPIVGDFIEALEFTDLDGYRFL